MKWQLTELNLDGGKLTGLPTPTADAEAATKKYVDDKIADVSGSTAPPGFGDDFLELPNGVKDSYDSETGEVVRRVKQIDLVVGDTLLYTSFAGLPNHDLVVVKDDRTTDWSQYNISTSVRQAGTAEVDGFIGVADESAIYGRHSVFCVKVAKGTYASTQAMYDALFSGKKLRYELKTPTREYVGFFSGISTRVNELNSKVTSMEQTIENSDLQGAPTYVQAESNRVADLVSTKRTFQSFVFGAATDLHTDGEDVSAVGVKHAGQAMKIIAKRTQLDLVALLGDYPFRYYDEDQNNKNALTYIRRQFVDSSINCPFLMMQGNHDLLRNDYGNHAKSKQMYYSYIGANNVFGVTDFANRFRNYGYIDFDQHKIRVVYFNSADLADVPSGYVGATQRLSKEQYQWMISTGLNLNKTDANQWGVIVLSHHPINDDFLQNFHSLIGAFKGKKSGSFTVDGTTISYNFAGVTSEFIAHFHGHNHNFRVKSEVDPTHSQGVLSITIPNACFGRNNEYGTAYGAEAAAKYGDADDQGNQRVFNKTAGTKDDTAFNIVVVDRGEKKIHCINYGAGIDREISY